MHMRVLAVVSFLSIHSAFADFVQIRSTQSRVYFFESQSQKTWVYFKPRLLNFDRAKSFCQKESLENIHFRLPSSQEVMALHQSSHLTNIPEFEYDYTVRDFKKIVVWTNEVGWTNSAIPVIPPTFAIPIVIKSNRTVTYYQTKNENGEIEEHFYSTIRKPMIDEVSATALCVSDD